MQVKIEMLTAPLAKQMQQNSGSIDSRYNWANGTMAKRVAKLACNPLRGLKKMQLTTKAQHNTENVGNANASSLVVPATHSTQIPGAAAAS